jgi:hypothetical protein
MNAAGGFLDELGRALAVRRNHVPSRSIRPEFEVLEDRLTPSSNIPAPTMAANITPVQNNSALFAGHGLAAKGKSILVFPQPIVTSPMSSNLLIPILRLQSDNMPFLWGQASYLSKISPSDISAGFFSEMANTQIAKDDGTVTQVVFWTTAEDADALRLDDLKKVKDNMGRTDAPGPSKMAPPQLPELFDTPKKSLLLEIKKDNLQPGQTRQDAKKLILGLRQASMNQEELLSRLADQRGPAHLVMVVLVLSWGIGSRKEVSRHRRDENHFPLSNDQWLPSEEEDIRSGRDGARAPPSRAGPFWRSKKDRADSNVGPIFFVR